MCVLGVCVMSDRGGCVQGGCVWGGGGGGGTLPVPKAHSDGH